MTTATSFIPVAGRRPRISSYEELVTHGVVDPSLPRAAGEALIAFCERWNLQLTPGRSDAYICRSRAVDNPTSPEDYIYQPYAHMTAFLRHLRETGLWLPGRTSFTGFGESLTATATCSTRESTSSESWVETSACARYFVYYQRDADGRSPIQRWEWMGDVMLAQTAEVLVARKALGHLIAELLVDCGSIELGNDIRVQRGTLQENPHYHDPDD